ncbi:MAG: sensor histidine kinase [Chloroflexota bacterium]
MGLAMQADTAGASRRRRRGGHQGLAWTVCGLSLSLLVTALIIQGANLLSGRLSIQSATDIAPGLAAVAVQMFVTTLGVLLVSRHRENPIGWIFLAAGTLAGLSNVADSYSMLAGPPGLTVAAWLANVAQGPILFGFFVFVFLLFPNGHLPSPRWRPVAWGASGALALIVASFAVLPGPLQSDPLVSNPFGIGPLSGTSQVAGNAGFIALMLSLGASAVSLVVRFRRSRGEERLQLKWVASATVLAALVLLTGPIFWFVLPPRVAQWWPAVFFLAASVIPTSIAVAVLKYRLYDIDLLINRALVYGGLTAGVVGLYVVAVGYLGAVLRTSNNLGISLVATGLVAVLFQPAREWLQRGVNHVIYGERDDPYRVIARLGRRLEGTLTPEALLPAVVETVAQALKLPYAAITLRQGEDDRIVAATGTPARDTRALPLTYQHEVIGWLLVAPRVPGESFGPADLRLLSDLARQASVAAHAVRLTAELQRSRERLVTAREEERRRLRRDLHDSLGPSLAAQTLMVGSARAIYPHDHAAADALLVELERVMEASLANVRRLVYALRPPALDDLGLVGAIRDTATHYQKPAGGKDDELCVRFEVPDDLPELPAAVEVAAYRIAQEALTNVVRHAHAQNCQVRLQILPEGDRTVLELAIVDDGVGLAAERRAGVGLASMRERAAELSGTLVIGTRSVDGTSVCVRFPLPTPSRAVVFPVALTGGEEANQPVNSESARPEGLARRQ